MTQRISADQQVSPEQRKENYTIRTAAEMVADKSLATQRVAPEVFRVDMKVQHPTYGVGRIIALGGAGRKRKAKVQFAAYPDPVTFSLAFSPLRPYADP